MEITPQLNHLVLFQLSCVSVTLYAILGWIKCEDGFIQIGVKERRIKNALCKSPIKLHTIFKWS